MVTTFPAIEEVTPEGSPVIFTLVAPPPKVYWIGVIASPEQIVWLLLPEVKLKVLPLILITILSEIEAPHMFVAVNVKVIELPETAVVGTIYEVIKLLGLEKLPEGAVHKMLVCPWAVPVKFIVSPGQADRGVVPASTVKGGIGAVQPLFT